jgi:hypothetical protein
MENALQKCLALVKEKFNRGEPEKWSPRTFDRLSQKIQEASGISISSHTLKRLYGRVKTPDEYDPQSATKEALSIFIGFKTWDDYIESKGEITITKDKKYDHRVILYIALSVLLGFIIYYIIDNGITFSKSYDYEFKVTNLKGHYPHKVSVHYDISGIKDNVYIYFGDYSKKIKLDPSKYVINHSYLFPDNFELQLIINNKVCETVFIQVLSDGWFGNVIYKENITKQRFLHEIQHIYDSSHHSLYISPRYVYELGIPKKQGFWTEYRYVKNINADGDNFNFECRVKNNEKQGGIKCHDFIYKVLCDSGIYEIRFEMKGCLEYAELRISEITLSGKEQELDAFGRNLFDWTKINMSVKDRNVQIFIKDKSIFSIQYNQPMGKIRGIILVFRGCGLADYVKISDINHNVVFMDQFNPNNS